MVIPEEGGCRMTSEIWRPWPKQELALKTVVFEMLYGG